MEREEVQSGAETSGSCALVCLVVDSVAYFANVGDSRAVASRLKGRDVVAVTTDHKPNVLSEKRRILANGGNVYR